MQTIWKMANLFCKFWSIVIFFLLIFENCVGRRINHVEENFWENNDDPYHHKINFDREGNYVCEYLVNWDSRTILFNLTVKTRGYVGFGISFNGVMEGADIVIGGVNSSTGDGYLYDMHVPLGTKQPVLDSLQDYKLLSAWENGTHTSLSFSRGIESCDEDDVGITDDTQRFLWAFGEKDELTLYHYQNRGEYVLQILAPDFTPRRIQEALRLNQTLTEGDLGDVKVWTVSRTQVLPKRETIYWCSITKSPSLNRKHHIVGFNFRLENELQARHVHHLTLQRCRAPPGTTPNDYFQPYLRNNTGESCAFRETVTNGLPYQHCQELIYTFGIGMRMFFLPSHIGIPLGFSSDEYFLLDVHYDNPARADLEIEINMDIYYTSEFKKHDAGQLMIGHLPANVASILIPPMSLHHHSYAPCGASCTGEMIPPEGIKLTSVFQHTHNSGKEHRVRQFRNGKELPVIVEDRNYDIRTQLKRHLRNEIEVLPGDVLLTECVYNNAWAGGRAVVAGYSTSQEMCNGIFYYYNRIPEYSTCLTRIENESYQRKYLAGISNTTWNDEALEFEATAPRDIQGLVLSEISTKRVEWTEKLRKDLQRDHATLAQMNYCVNSDFAAGGGIPQGKLTEMPRSVAQDNFGVSTKSKNRNCFKKGYHSWLLHL